MKIFDITGDSFTDEIENYNGTVLIDFFAEWCKPCKMMSPVIEDIAVNAGDDIKVCKVNVDSEKALAQRFGIMSIPIFDCVNGGMVTLGDIPYALPAVAVIYRQSAVSFLFACVFDKRYIADIFTHATGEDYPPCLHLCLDFEPAFTCHGAGAGEYLNSAVAINAFGRIMQCG